MNGFLARIRRGYARMWSWVMQRFTKRRNVTVGQQETARETRVMLGILAEASAAGPAMTDEQRMLLAQSLPGMRAREAVLLAVPNRSLVEENELQMIRREMARIEGRESEGVRPAATIRPLANFGGVFAGIAPYLPVLLVIAAIGTVTGWGGSIINGIRADRYEAQRDDARAASERNAQTAREWRAQFEEAHSEVIRAQQQAAASAETLAAAQRRTQAAVARERRIRRETAEVLTGGAAPDWERSMRDDELPQPGAGPGSGDASGGDSGGMQD